VEESGSSSCSVTYLTLSSVEPLRSATSDINYLSVSVMTFVCKLLHLDSLVLQYGELYKPPNSERITDFVVLERFLGIRISSILVRFRILRSSHSVFGTRCEHFTERPPMSC
jgi:hypothetical protein